MTGCSHVTESRDYAPITVSILFFCDWHCISSSKKQDVSIVCFFWWADLIRGLMLHQASYCQYAVSQFELVVATPQTIGLQLKDFVKFPKPIEPKRIQSPISLVALSKCSSEEWSITFFREDDSAQVLPQQVFKLELLSQLHCKIAAHAITQRF